MYSPPGGSVDELKLGLLPSLSTAGLPLRAGSGRGTGRVKGKGKGKGASGSDEALKAAHLAHGRAWGKYNAQVAKGFTTLRKYSKDAGQKSALDHVDKEITRAFKAADESTQALESAQDAWRLSILSQLKSNSHRSSPAKLELNYLDELLDQAQSTKPESEEGGQLLNSFLLKPSDIVVFEDKPLGEGAFGVVYKGICRGKTVAVKTLRNVKFDERVVEDFLRECNIMRSLPHSNILLFMGACIEPPLYMLVTELAGRGSLASLLQSSEIHLSFPRKMGMCKQIAGALNWLHCQSPPLLHLDLKPANILIDDDYNVRIADFGMSRMKVAAGVSNVSGGGTPLYMPPEILSRKEQSSEKTDVFAFGIIVWEMLTEVEPYQKQFRSIPSLIRAVTSGVRPTIPANTPPSLKTLMTRCWADASDRPSFETIIADDPFHTAISEAVSDGEAMVKDLWGSFGKTSNGASLEAVAWSVFAPSFCNALNEEFAKKQMELAALKALLDVGENHDRVTIQAFQRFLGHFRPLSPRAGSSESSLYHVHNLVLQKWFWGTMDALQANEVLKSAKPGTYLVRFSASAGGNMSVSYVAKHSKKSKQVAHMRIPRVPGEDVVTTVNRLMQQSGFKAPAAGRPSKFMTLSPEANSVLYAADSTDVGDQEAGTLEKGWKEGMFY
eukprot:TRINITY_DN11005_c0_g1_i1.p1 TRINITY_DN11005_c0_g1~~TRINITY_DN11005_c0_g1_i1.p1  ORF type:complete len:675 (-),score=118.16 TRINITY_DN11005_c0_g1_i1:12-2015(-)